MNGVKMPILFSTHPDGYYVVSFQGLLSDQEVLERCQDFYQDYWQPGLPQLSDLSEADFSGVSGEGVLKVAKLVQELQAEHGEAKSKLAVYAPTDLPFGLARMYSALVEKSPSLVAVFRDYQEALDWLKAPQS